MKSIPTLFALWALLPALVQAQELSREVEFNIPAQGLPGAVVAFSEQSGIQVVTAGEDLTRLQAPQVHGRLTIVSALERLLSATKLEYKEVAEGTIALIGHDGRSARASADSGDMRLARAESPTSADQSAGGDVASTPGESKDGLQLDEVIVTAQKRSERLQDVPVPVTALSADLLINSNQLRIQDYYTRIPGVNLTYLGDVGASLVAIRGVTPGGYVNPTVGIVVDDVPYGGSVAFVTAAWALTPDLDPSELERIEVLRGPQGTLYGASSMGGLIKYVTADPQIGHSKGRLQIGTSTVEKSSDLGYAARASANVSMSDTFALRASGSLRRDPGYVDNVQTNEDDINSTEATTARLATLWQPSEDFSLKLSALHQNTQRDGAADSYLLPGLEDLEQDVLIGTGWFEQEVQVYSATLGADLGRAKLTALSGYSRGSLESSIDLSRLAAYSGPALTTFGVTGASNPADSRFSKFSQELRLSIPLAERFEWLLGAFYTSEKHDLTGEFVAVDSATGAVPGVLTHIEAEGSYREFATFTDLTVQFADRFDVQFGARHSDNRGAASSATTQAVAPFFSNSVTPEGVSKDKAFTYLVTPRLKVSPDLMLYARFASGFRPGGPNLNLVGTTSGLPVQYGNDTTRNYELGVKGNALDRRVTFDASLYYIDWKDVQLGLRSSTPAGVLVNYIVNGGGARSQGVELAGEFRPLESLSVSAWVAYNDSNLTEVPANSTLVAFEDAQLPYSAPWSGNLAVSHEFPLGATTMGFVGASWSYVGDRKGRFFTSCPPGSLICTGFPQSDIAGYSQLDLSAGARFDSWAINAFVNNLADKRGVLRGGRDAALSLQYVVTTIQPRTIGLSVTKSF